MNLVFDTSALSKLLSNDEHMLTAFKNQSWEQLFVPLAVDAELRFGFKHGSREQKNLAIYQKFMIEFSVEVVIPDQTTSILYADLATWCRKQGVGLSHNDIWIAAIAVQTAGRLLTTDKDFATLPQLALVAM